MARGLRAVLANCEPEISSAEACAAGRASAVLDIIVQSQAVSSPCAGLRTNAADNVTSLLIIIMRVDPRTRQRWEECAAALAQWWKATVTYGRD